MRPDATERKVNEHFVLTTMLGIEESSPMVIGCNKMCSKGLVGNTDENDYYKRLSSFAIAH